MFNCRIEKTIVYVQHAQFRTKKKGVERFNVLNVDLKFEFPRFPELYATCSTSTKIKLLRMVQYMQIHK